MRRDPAQAIGTKMDSDGESSVTRRRDRLGRCAGLETDSSQLLMYGPKKLYKC